MMQFTPPNGKTQQPNPAAPGVPKQVFFGGSAVPMGGGIYTITPGKPLPDEMSPKLAAKFLGISRPTIYRLIEDGTLPSRRATPSKILVPASSVIQFKEATRDPEFWQRRKEGQKTAKNQKSSPPPNPPRTACGEFGAGTANPARQNRRQRRAVKRSEQNIKNPKP